MLIKDNQGVQMYRVLVYVNNRPVALYSELRKYDEADRLLERAISSDFATGGHIEQDVPGIGWCVASEPDVVDMRGM